MTSELGRCARVDNILCQVDFFFCLFVCFYSLLQDNTLSIFSTRRTRCTLSFGTRKPADSILSHGSEIFNNNNKNGDISRCIARCELAASLRDIHVNTRAEQERITGKYPDNLLNAEFSLLPWH